MVNFFCGQRSALGSHEHFTLVWLPHLAPSRAPSPGSPPPSPEPLPRGALRILSFNVPFRNWRVPSTRLGKQQAFTVAVTSSLFSCKLSQNV